MILTENQQRSNYNFCKRPMSKSKAKEKGIDAYMRKS